MSDDALLDALLGDVARCGGLSPRSDWTTQAREFLALFAVRNATTIEDVLRDRSRWPALLPGLFACLTVGETHFFRHASHFDRLVDALAARLADPFSIATIVSAGCATGEEPYSVAIAVHRRLGAHALARTRILGVDISGAAIEKARAGTYRPWSFRQTPEWLLPGYFYRRSELTWQMVDVIRHAATLEVAHLLEFVARLPAGSVSAVFFRNVGIYLHPRVVESAYHQFQRVLEPNGLLFIAPADPRPRAEEFVDDEHESNGVYRCQSEPAPGVRAGPPSQKRHRAPATPRFAPGSSGVESESSVESADVGDVESRAMELADRGDLDGALAIVSDFVNRSPAVHTGYWVRACIALGAGDTESAIDDLRQTIFLCPKHRIARYWYVLALRDTGHGEQALEQACVLEKLLEAAGGALLEDGDTTAGELLDALRFTKEGLT